MAKRKIIQAGAYTIKTNKLKAPLWIIYTAFTDGLEIQDTLDQLNIIVDDYVMKSNDKNLIGLSHNIEKVLVMTQLLTACAMIGNSFHTIKNKK